MNEEKRELSVLPDALPAAVEAILTPVLSALTKMLENNTKAIEELSAAQSVQNDRLEALERQIRLQTPVTQQQARYLNEAIRRRARELLDKRGVEDANAVKRLSAAIRRSVLARYGIGALREIPRHEYTVALSQIGMYADMLALKDIVREARAHAEASE